MSTNCKLAKLALNFDMSGMVMPCSLTKWYLKDLKDDRHFNVLTDDVEKIWNSEHRKKLIADHNNGVRNPACNTCWYSEDAGVQSFRQKYNEMLKEVDVLESQPRIIVLKPGNLCNNACRSCNAHTSSMWYKTDYAMKNQDKTFKEYVKFFDRHKTAYNNNEMLEKKFAEWEDNIISWDMYGGEPMIIPLFFKLLDQSINNKNVKEKTFSVHTNGMVYVDDLIEKFSKFKSASMGFSVDAIGKQNDYIRYGSKWDDIISNLKRYMADCKNYNNVSIGVRTTITPWNLYHYDETYEYFKNIGINASGVWCDDKPWNDVRYLPFQVKQAILSKLSKYGQNDEIWINTLDKLKKWIITEPKNYKELQNSFLEFNNKVDKIRNEKFKDVFPEYSKLF
jgi:radical SAM protein with 4Fe4S-binding SPASM domain